MVDAQHAVRAFIWFLWQCSVVGGLGAPLFWIPAISLAAGMVISFRRSPVTVRGRFWLLALLPISWIAVGLWGGYFWVDTSPNRYHPNPPWVSWPVYYGLWIFLAMSVLLVLFMRHGRTFATLVAVGNLYFMFGMTLMAGMAISGIWL